MADLYHLQFQTPTPHTAKLTNFGQSVGVPGKIEENKETRIPTFGKSALALETRWNIFMDLVDLVGVARVGLNLVVT